MNEQSTNVFTFLAMRPAKLATSEESPPPFIEDPRVSQEGDMVVRVAASLHEPAAVQEHWDTVDVARLEQVAAKYRDLRDAYGTHEADSRVPVRQYPPGSATTRMPPVNQPPRSDPRASDPRLAGPRGYAPQAVSQQAAPQRAGAIEEAIAGLRAALYPIPVGELENYAWDVLYLAYRFGAVAGPKLELPISVLRAIHFDKLAQQGRITDAAHAWDALEVTPLVPPRVAQFPVTRVSAPEPAVVAASVDRERMIDVVSDVTATQRLLDMARDVQPVPDPVVHQNPVPAESDDLVRSAARVTAMPTIGDTLPIETSDVDRNVLTGLNLDERTPLDVGVRRLAAHAADLTRQAYALRNEPGFTDIVREHGSPALIGLIPPVLRPLDVVVPQPGQDVNAVGLIKPLGIGDLKVVKQTLLAYQPGEVAHIENVLKGESKQRTFRTLDRAENTLFTSEETTEDTERDTQSTDRFEVKKEAESTISEDMSVQAGLTVSASFGPVTTTAHGDFAYATSKQESVRNSANFAREVVDKSVSKVEKKIKTERTQKTFHEVEETDVHGVDNKAGAGHVTGVYRWVDKKYRAQVYNYGRRLMFEFVVPEPAAYFRAAQDEQTPKVDATPPAPFLNANGDPLTAADITPENYEILAGRYFTSGVVPPPAPFTYAATTIDYEGANAKTFARGVKDLAIPAGYSLIGYHAEVSYVYQYYPKIFLSIENRTFAIVNVPSQDTAAIIGTGSADSPAPFNPGADYRARATLPVSMVGYDVLGLVANVQATCKSTPENDRAWQLATFDKIYAAYRALQTEYDQKVTQAKGEAANSVLIAGRNPGINRQIEQTELKKLSITMLTGQHYNTNHSMVQDGGMPEVDVLAAIDEGKQIQFFEQAFDWQQMTYLFYPYFWGKKTNWTKLSSQTDPDPLFANFLQSGSARVVVPVFPAYTDAVLWYLETKGTQGVWKGGESPRLDDADGLFKSIADEVRSQTDDLAGAVPEGDPWEYTVPTTLVWLQPEPTLPVFT